MFHLTISTWQLVYKILYNVCSIAFLLPFGTQMPMVVLLKLSYFLSIKGLEIFGSSSLEILLKEGLRPSRIILLDLLNRAKYESTYTVSFNQIVCINSVMIGSTFNFKFLGLPYSRKNLLTNVNMMHSRHVTDRHGHHAYTVDLIPFILRIITS